MPHSLRMNGDHAPSAEADCQGLNLSDVAEAIESKHRVRERLVRALARTELASSAPAGAFDAAAGELPPARSGLGLEGNPLGEYLLNCELRETPFRL